MPSADEYATNRPSGVIEIAGAFTGKGDSWPHGLTLILRVIPDCRSRTNTSHTLFVSPSTRSEAPDLKATNRPSSLTSAEELGPLLAKPAAVTLIGSKCAVPGSSKMPL